MSPDTGGPDDVDPVEQERVRELLAAAGRSAAPVPAEVRDRLDETLAELLAERSGSESSLPGVTAGARPRRRAARWLVALAAAVVVVLGGMSVAGLGGFSSPTRTAQSGAQTDSGSGAGAGDAGAGAASEPAQVGPAERQQDGHREAADAGQVPVVGSGSFAADADQVVRRLDSGELAPGRDPRCAGPTPGVGQQSVRVDLDGHPAVLLVHQAREGRRLVQAWDCAGARRLGSARVPAR